MRALVAHAGLFGALALTACSSDTDIIGRCESVTEAGLFLSGDNGNPYVWWSPSVGLLGDHLWVTYVQQIDDKWLGLGRWYDARTLVPTSEPVRLGTVYSWELQHWVRDGDALVGQVWADPDEPVEIMSEDRLVHLWRVTPPPTPTSDGQRVAVTTAVLPPGFRAISLDSLHRAGLQGAIPIAITRAGPLGALVFAPPCVGSSLGNVKINVFGGDLVAIRLPFPTDVCDVSGAGTPWLFSIDDE